MIIRKFSLVLLVLVLGLCSAYIAFAAEENNTQQIETAIEKDVETIVENIEMGIDGQLVSDVSNNVKVFLREKEDAYQYVRSVYNYEKTNFKVNANLLEKKVEDAQLILLYAVESWYQYKDDPSEEASGECVEIQVVVDLEKNQMIDFYEKEDAFDEAIREVNSSTYRSGINKINKLPAKTTIINKAEEFKAEVLEQCAQQDNVNLTENMKNRVEPTASYTWLQAQKPEFFMVGSSKFTFTDIRLTDIIKELSGLSLPLLEQFPSP